jgi:hypothetical protein
MQIDIFRIRHTRRGHEELASEIQNLPETSSVPNPRISDFWIFDHAPIGEIGERLRSALMPACFS